MFDAFLVFVVLYSLGYFLYKSHENTRQILNEQRNEHHDSISREEVLELISAELENKISKVLEAQKQQSSYEESDRFEKPGSSNVIPRLKVVK